MRFVLDDWLAPAWRGFRRLLGIVRAHRGLSVLALSLFAVDLLWIVHYGVCRSLHELEITSRFYEMKGLRITTEGGIPEWFNYVQTLFVVALLVRLARSTRQLIYVALAVVFFIVVLDDSLAIHENVGKFFVRMLAVRPVLGLRANDIGEVLAWWLIGLATVPLLFVGLDRARPPHRENGLAFCLAFGALLFCAIFVDQLYSNFHDLFVVAGTLIDLVEDGGEMLAITCAAALALGADRESRSG